MTSPLQLHIDLDALAANWRWFAQASGDAETGAAVKADGYGLGARQVVDRLASEGCRHFFFTTHDEIAAFGEIPAGITAYALHGFRDGDVPLPNVVPVLNTSAQLARWKFAAPDTRCDLMLDTGMNRLGFGMGDLSLSDLSGLGEFTLHSHLACADDPDSEMNAAQLSRLHEAAAALQPARLSIASSGGICLGKDYALDLTRPGLGIYGGIPNPAAAGELRQVVSLRSEILQVRDVGAGEAVGYGCIWTAGAPTRIATLNIGYADGYLRGFSNSGSVRIHGEERPVVGRISMDMATVDIGDLDAREGDWADVVYDLPTASAQSGLSQYELLTGLGSRYRRIYA